MKAILTYARGWNTLAAVRSLGKKGIEVVTADEYDFAPSYFSKYSVDNFRYPNPDQDADGFIETLLEHIQAHQPEDGKFVLMPFHKETYLIAKHRDKFEPYIHVPVPDYDSIMKVHDKVHGPFNGFWIQKNLRQRGQRNRPQKFPFRAPGVGISNCGNLPFTLRTVARSP